MFKKFFPKSKQLYIWFFSYLAIVLVGVIISFFMYFTSANILRNQTEKNMEFTVDQIRRVCDEDFFSIQNTTLNILEDNSLKALTDGELYADYSLRRVKYNDICKRISTSINENVEKFFIVFENSDLILDSSGSATKKVIFNDFFKPYYPSMEDWLSDFNMRNSFSDCKFLTSENGKTVLCYIQRTPISTIAPVKATAMVIINTDEIINNRLSFAEYTNPILTILNEDNDILFSSSGDTPVDKSVMKESEHISVSLPSEFINLKYQLSIPKESLYQALKNLQAIALSTYLVYLIAGVFLSYYLSKRSYKPLSFLMQKFSKEPRRASQNEFLYLNDKINQMVEKDTSTQKELNSQLNKLREHYLADLVFGRDKQSSSKKAYRVEFKKGGFYLVLFKVLETGIFEEDAPDNIETINFLIQNVFAEITENIANTYFFHCEDMYACIINSKNEISEIEICTHTEFTIKFLQEAFSTHIISAVSNFALSESQLPVLYRQAKDIISVVAHSSGTSVLTSDTLPEITYVFPQETEHLLMASLMSGDYPAAKELIDSIFLKTFDKNNVVPSIKQIFFCDLITIVLKLSATLNDNKQFYSMFNEVFYADDINASKQILLDYIKILCDMVIENNKMVDDRIKEITEFVHNNYRDPNLNVSYIANKFDITINYLSSYFKSKTGQMLSDYILKYRLGRACEMLNDNVSVTKTCHNCGFYDVNAFIRAFKKTYGVTPGKYNVKK